MAKEIQKTQAEDTRKPPKAGGPRRVPEARAERGREEERGARSSYRKPSGFKKSHHALPNLRWQYRPWNRRRLH